MVDRRKKELSEFDLQKATLAWHYGWEDRYIESLSQSVFDAYYRAITHIEAEKLAIASRISLLGRMKKPSIDKWMSDLSRLKFKSKSSRKVTVQDLAVKISEGAKNGGK